MGNPVTFFFVFDFLGFSYHRFMKFFSIDGMFGHFPRISTFVQKLSTCVEKSIIRPVSQEEANDIVQPNL